MMEDISVTQTDLLYPELLSKETLVHLLQQRYIKLDDHQKEDKGILVEIFLRMVTPRPQREPCPNRRGRITAEVIRRLDAAKLRDRSRGDGNINDSACSTSQNKSSQRGGLFLSADLPSNPSGASRLKPPPVIINKKKSLVKLTPSKPGSTSPAKEAKPTTSPKAGHKNIVLSPSSSSPATRLVRLSPASTPSASEDMPSSKATVSVSSNQQCQETTAVTKKVSLKRTTSGENGEKQDETVGEDTPKKKIKKISWP